MAVLLNIGYLILAILGLPLRILARRRELRDALTKQSWGSWGIDRIKSTLFGLLFVLLAVQTLYWTIRNFGEAWWVVLWVLALGFSLLIGFLGPVVLLPLFYRVAEVTLLLRSSRPRVAR